MASPWITRSCCGAYALLLSCGSAPPREPTPSHVAGSSSALTSPCSSARAQGSARAPGPAHQERKAELPPVPTLPDLPIRQGDAFTVHGATHHLRSTVHASEVRDKELTIVGYVVRTNFADAPPCAVHRRGKADPDGCYSPVPAFWIGDDPSGAGPQIKVMGFASNWAQLHDAILSARRGSSAPMVDEFWGIEVPHPVPNKGAHVRVRGRYGFAFNLATSGIEVDPTSGIMTYQSLDYLQPPPTPATLPGM